jgi:hypothetical protein
MIEVILNDRLGKKVWRVLRVGDPCCVRHCATACSRQISWLAQMRLIRVLPTQFPVWLAAVVRPD